MRVLAFMSCLRCSEPIEAVRVTIGTHWLRGTPVQSFRPRSKGLLRIVVTLALKTDAYGADARDRRCLIGKDPRNSGKLPVRSCGARNQSRIVDPRPGGSEFLRQGSLFGWRRRVGRFRSYPTARQRHKPTVMAMTPAEQPTGGAATKSEDLRRLCHVNLNWPREVSTTQFEFMRLSQLATSETLRLGGCGACGGM